MQRATDEDFSVRVRQVAGATVVTVVGEVDLDTAPELEFRLIGAADRPEPLVIDLSGVTFFASAGLACLLLARGQGGRPHLVPSPAVVRVLTLSDLEDFLPRSASLEDALVRVAG
ncbi:STAS domain-containing protein [Umezawaea sp. NPDC059074]|uniref:STAS domain-containing protein n=1 Tax=Umezawaea sp. NPDC059074 TaxID=3346716 RepID=UPI0036CCFC37